MFVGEKDYAEMPEWINVNNIDKIKFYNSVDSIEIIKEALRIYSENKK